MPISFYPWLRISINSEARVLAESGRPAAKSKICMMYCLFEIIKKKILKK